MGQLKKMNVFMVVLSLLVLAMACSNGNGQTESATTPAAQSAPESTPKKEVQNVKLSIIMPQTALTEWLKTAISNYEAKTPGVTFDLQVLPDGQVEELVRTKIATGETPDIYPTYTGILKTLNPAENFMAYPEDEPFVARLYDNVLQDLQIDGKVYGPPFGQGVGWGYLYNKDLFEKYNVKVPENYEEFLMACEEFKKNGITAVFASDKELWTTQIWFTVLAPQAVKHKPDTFQNIIENKLKWAEVPEFEEVLAKQLELYQKGYRNKDFLSASYDDAMRALAEGTAAMGLYGPWSIPDIKKVNPDANIGVGAVPGNDDPYVVAGGSAGFFAVFKKSKNPEAAMDFVRYLIEPETLELIYKEQPSSSPAYKDEEPRNTMEPWAIEIFEKYHKTGKTIVELNNIIPVSVQALWTLEQDMVAGGKTPKQVLEAWDKEFANLMKSKNMPGW